MKYTAVTVRGKASNREEILLLLSQYEIYEYEEKSHDIVDSLMKNERTWDYIDPTVLEVDPESLLITFYLSEEEGHDFLDELREDLKAKGLGELETENVDEEDWAHNWKKYYKPLKVTDDLVIVPSWEDYKAEGNEKVIYINPGMAFGTGTHETTFMCMEVLSDYIKGGEQVFDIGTGSGILSLVALAMGAEHAIGVDLDPVCISAAKENRELNKMEDRFTVYEGNLLDIIQGEANLVVANIMAEVIVTMIDDLKEHLRENGLFVASGIILRKREMVKQALVDAGLTIIDDREDGEWVCLVAKRIKA